MQQPKQGDFKDMSMLTFLCIMSENGQTHFENFGTKYVNIDHLKNDYLTNSSSPNLKQFVPFETNNWNVNKEYGIMT